MGQVYARALAVLVVAGALVACGGGGDDGAEKVGETDGLATYEVESSGFSVGIPAGWRTVSADEVYTEERLDEIREADPELGPVLDAIAARTLQSSCSPQTLMPTPASPRT